MSHHDKDTSWLSWHQVKIASLALGLAHSLHSACGAMMAAGLQIVGLRKMLQDACDHLISDSRTNSIDVDFMSWDVHQDIVGQLGQGE